MKELTRNADAFWRKFTLPQEDRVWPWDGIGYRWFRSSNVIPLEQWRRKAAERTRENKAPTSD